MFINKRIFKELADGKVNMPTDAISVLYNNLKNCYDNLSDFNSLSILSQIINKTSDDIEANNWIEPEDFFEFKNQLNSTIKTGSDIDPTFQKYIFEDFISNYCPECKYASNLRNDIKDINDSDTENTPIKQTNEKSRRFKLENACSSNSSMKEAVNKIDQIIFAYASKYGQILESFGEDKAKQMLHTYKRIGHGKTLKASKVNRKRREKLEKQLYYTKLKADFLKQFKIPYARPTYDKIEPYINRGENRRFK